MEKSRKRKNKKPEKGALNAQMAPNRPSDHIFHAFHGFGSSGLHEGAIFSLFSYVGPPGIPFSCFFFVFSDFYFFPQELKNQPQNKERPQSIVVFFFSIFPGFQGLGFHGFSVFLGFCEDINTIGYEFEHPL